MHRTPPHMPKRPDMLDSLDSLKMLASDGVFANKEGIFSKKVAPEAPPNAAQQALHTEEERLRTLKAQLDEFKAGLDEFRERLDTQDKLQIKRNQDLDKRESSVQQKEYMVDLRISMNKNTYEEERLKNEKEEKRLQETAGRLGTRNDELAGRERELQIGQRRIDALQEECKTNQQRMQSQEREQKAIIDNANTARQELVYEKNSHKIEKEKVEDLTKKVDLMKECDRSEALRALKTFVCMWKDELLTLNQTDKLRCLIPHDTTTWFKATYYRLDEPRKLHFMLELGRVSDVYYRDLRVDINTAGARFVIFYRQSKLEEYAKEAWNGNLVIALYNMHRIQADDRDKVDEKIKLTEV